MRCILWIFVKRLSKWKCFYNRICTTLAIVFVSLSAVKALLYLICFYATIELCPFDLTIFAISPAKAMFMLDKRVTASWTKSENPQQALDKPLYAVDRESMGGCDEFLLGQWDPELVNPVLSPQVGSCRATLICGGVFLGSWDLTQARQPRLGSDLWILYTHTHTLSYITLGMISPNFPCGDVFITKRKFGQVLMVWSLHNPGHELIFFMEVLHNNVFFPICFVEIGRMLDYNQSMRMLNQEWLNWLFS